MGARGFFVPRNAQISSWNHPTSYPIDAGVKQPGRESTRFPPLSAEVKHARNYISSSSYVFMVLAQVSIGTSPYSYLNTYLKTYSKTKQEFGTRSEPGISRIRKANQSTATFGKNIKAKL
jgi:hypothetical protein